MKKLPILILILYGAYVNAQPANDNKVNATDVSLLINGCSPNAAYTTIAATADQAAGTCAPNGPNYNVWFKFTATTSFINVKLKNGGAFGTMTYGWATLWDGAGTQLACSPYNSLSSGIMEFSYLGLTPTTTYYISIDNYVGAGYRGTFSLCLSDVVDYDYKVGAVDVSGLINGCSANAAYSTLGASADQAAGTCAPNGPNYNRWFKFVASATTYINVQLKNGGALGSMTYGWVTLWDGAGTQLSCSPYNSLASGTMETNYLGLTPGVTYYISVDNYVGLGYRGTFSLCLSDVVDYDYKIGAINVSGLINGCSANAAYSTNGASADQAAGTCAPNGPNYNRWFKFIATATTYINVQLKNGGALGSMTYGWVTLWDGAGTQLACSPYNSLSSGTMETSYLGLTPGVTYYISVDNYVGLGYRGTFSLCLSDVINYDYKIGALDVTPLINGCSLNGTYSTIGASPDQAAGTCAPNGPNYNRWFKFTASASTFINVQLKTGGVYGSMTYGWVTLWDAGGTQLSCSPYNSLASGTMETSYLGLTPGLTYYISVDNYVGLGYRGTFSLCLNDVINYDYKAGAVDLSDLINKCTTNGLYSTIGASADQAAGTCAPNGPNYNRWFKFTATTNFINLQLKNGGAFGTMTYGWITLWDAGGTQLACSPYNSLSSGTMETSYLGLTPGVTYYFSVDNYVGLGYRGTFTLCLNDIVDYDFKQGARDVTTLINGCSANALYSTIGASADQSAGTCAPNGPNYNRWFKFTATASTYIDIQMKNGGALGSMTYGWVTLWDGAGTQLACSQYNSLASGTMETDFIGLTPGVTYYISVDNYVGLGYRGTFTLCLSDVPDYNYYQGASSLTNLNNWCSANAAYSTISATADKNAGSCWANGPNYNRWFKFVAISPNVTIQMMTGGANGTLQYGFMSLWQSNGTTQIACTQYVSQYSNLSISSAALVVGNTYYISVDNYVGAGYRGTFKLCINNIGGTYYSRATGPWNDVNTWSTVGYGGVAAASFPGASDLALIQGYDITVTSNQQAAEIGISVASANTSLNVDNSTLTVNGLVSLSNVGNNFAGAITVQNNGSLWINDILTIGRSGGNQPFGVTINTGCSLTVNKDLNWSSNGGSTTNSLLTVNGTGIVAINRDVNLSSIGGPLIKLQFNNSSLFTVLRDINFTSSAAGLEAIELNNTAKLRIARNMVRGATPYGALTCNNASTVEFNGSSNAQTIAASAGSGGDSFYYNNVIFNSTVLFTPQLTLAGAVTVNGDLTMTSGIALTTATNLLQLKNTSNVSIGSTSCYVSGPMTYEVATSTANTARNFPIGKNPHYRPVILTVTHSSASSVTYTAEHFNSSAASLGYTLPPTVDRVSGNRYWRVNSSDQSNLTSAFITLYYGYGTSDGVTAPANLTVVKNVGVGTTWFDVGKVSATAEPGNIVSGSFNSFSDIALGDLNGGGNPLPISLKSFEAKSQGSSVLVKWSTASELNNDYFSVERSKQGAEFTEVLRIKGAGTKLSGTNYSTVDEHPLKGTSYYRLKQTDFNKQSTYSKVVMVTTDPLLGAQAIAFPNPTNGSDLNVRISGFDENEELMVNIVDSFGRSQWSAIIRADQYGESTVPVHTLNRLPGGVYIVLVASKQGTLHSKVVIR